MKSDQPLDEAQAGLLAASSNYEPPLMRRQEPLDIPQITTSPPPPAPTTSAFLDDHASSAFGRPPSSRSSSASLSPTPSSGFPRRSSAMTRPPEPGMPRTPRTANRVRFDLEEESPEHEDLSTAPLTPPKARNGSPRMPFQPFQVASPMSLNGHPVQPNSMPAWADDEDYLNSDAGAVAGMTRQDSMQSVHLLEGMEAPSVSLAMDDGSFDPEAGITKSGMRSAFMNMANSIIGAGIIGQPYAFRQAGLIAGVLLLIALTVTVDWTIRLIVINSKLSGADSFQSTMERCFGRPGLIAISLAQWIFAFGGMVAFCVIIGDTIPHVLTAVVPRLPEMSVLWLLADRRFIIILFVMGISFPLSLHRDIAKLAKASTLALISMLVILIAVITQGISVDPALKGTLRGSLGVKPSIFQAIGVISFAFVCHHNSLLIYGSLKKPTLDRFARVTHYSTGISMLACLTMALSGFLTFGDQTKGNILNNFPSDNVLVNVARFCFGLNMLTTLPLECFVCRCVLLEYFYPNGSHGEGIDSSSSSSPSDTTRHVVSTTLHVLAAVLLALLTCDLGAVFELVGATAACMLAYVLPPLCWLRLTTQQPSRARGTRIAAYACVTFGLAVMIISVVMTVIKMVTQHGEPARQCG